MTSLKQFIIKVTSTVLLIISFSSSVLAQKACELKNKLQGMWVCVQDSSYNITVKGDTMIENYKSDSQEIEIFLFSLSKRKCSTTFTKDKVRHKFYLKKADLKGENVFCYRIIDLSDSNFTYSYEGGSTYDFYKVN